MSANLRDKILNHDDIERKLVDVPVWGVKVEVRSMTAKQRQDLMARRRNDSGNEAWLYPELLVLCCYDPETGDKLFDPADRDTLNQKAAAPVETLAQTALTMSRMNEEAVAAEADRFRGEPE